MKFHREIKGFHCGAGDHMSCHSGGWMSPTKRMESREGGWTVPTCKEDEIGGQKLMGVECSQSGTSSHWNEDTSGKGLEEPSLKWKLCFFCFWLCNPFLLKKTWEEVCSI